MESIRRIVVGVDHTDTGVCALQKALELAARDGNTEVHAVRVVELTADPILGVFAAPDDDMEPFKAQLQVAVEKTISELGALRIKAVVAHLTIGSPARCIVGLAAQIDADVIVVGTHGRRGVKRALLGSVAEEVVRTGGCPVFAVRPKEHSQEGLVPAIEPLCEDCATTRFQTKNAKLWCEQHSAHHPRAHVYRYDERSTESVRAWGFHA